MRRCSPVVSAIRKFIREVLRAAVRRGTFTAMVLAHITRPGMPNPVRPRRLITTAGEHAGLVDIRVLDRFVVGHRGYLSLLPNGAGCENHRQARRGDDASAAPGSRLASYCAVVLPLDRQCARTQVVTYPISAACWLWHFAEERAVRDRRGPYALLRCVTWCHICGRNQMDTNTITRRYRGLEHSRHLALG